MTPQEEIQQRIEHCNQQIKKYKADITNNTILKEVNRNMVKFFGAKIEAYEDSLDIINDK